MEYTVKNWQLWLESVPAPSGIMMNLEFHSRQE